MSKMVSIKGLLARFRYHFVLLISLSVVVTETRSTTSTDTTDDPEYDISADIIEAMNNIDDPELFENYSIENDLPILDGVNLIARFGDSGDVQENSGNFVLLPPMPSCKPLKTLVSLKASKPWLVLKPPCLVVPRCGGCCPFGWKCLPVATEIYTYSIKEAEYIPVTKSVMFKGRINMTEEHHTVCKCKCNVNSKDCYSRGKVYDSENCKCICRNELENRFQCSQRGRQWNSDSCTCDCPVVTCKEEYFFDQEKCKCNF